MEGQAQEEHDEEVMSVPEHFKVRATNELKRRGYHEEESHCDDVTGDPSSSRKANCDRVLCVCVCVCVCVCAGGVTNNIGKLQPC